MMFRLAWLLTVLAAPAIAAPKGADAQKAETPSESDAGGEEPDTGPPGAEEGPVPAMGPDGIQAELLDTMFEQAAIGTRKARKLAGLAGVLGGVTLLGLGAWRLTESSDSRSTNEYSRGLGIMFTTLGMVDLTTGIIALKRASHEEKRHARWKKHREKKQLTQLELARYEGEFEASTRIRNSQRMLVRWNGLTHALAGVIVLSLAPIPDLSRRGRNSALIVGSVFVGAGAATFGLSFRPTANEKAWQQYKKGKAGGRSGGYEPSGGWFIQPMISHRELGLGMRGTF